MHNQDEPGIHQITKSGCPSTETDSDSMQQTVKSLHYVCISVSRYMEIQIAWQRDTDEPQEM